MSIEFFVTALVVIASPGTGVLVTLAAGLSRGTRAAVVAALGCTLGIVPHVLAATTGLAALLSTSAHLFHTIKYAGVAYLLYTAWMTLKQHGTLNVEADDTPRSDLQVIVSAVLVNLLNPKLSLFFFAFLPQFVRADQANPVEQMMSMSLVFMLLTFVVFVIYEVVAATARTHILSRPLVLTWMRRTFAACFVGLGAKLALSER